MDEKFNMQIIALYTYHLHVTLDKEFLALELNGLLSAVGIAILTT